MIDRLREVWRAWFGHAEGEQRESDEDERPEGVPADGVDPEGKVNPEAQP
jgi:hypothetical protein